MNNSQFRAIPKNNNFIIPFELTEDNLLNWLHDLSQYESQEASLQVLRLLQSLHKENISSTKRISFLSTISGYLNGYIDKLEGSCWDAGFPLAPEEKIYAEAVTWNYLTLSKGFFIAAQDASKKEAAFALASALNAITNAQLHIAAIYATVSDGFWQLVYKMFAMAEKRGLLNIKIKTLDNITVAAMFNKLFIFHACDASQFRARDIQTIFNFLDNVCNNMPINKKNDNQVSFVFYLDEHTQPTNNRRSKNIATVNARYFSPTVVAYEIYEILKTGDYWSGTLKSINKALFLRVIKTLNQGQKRKYTRLDEGYDVRGVIGFEHIINFLRHNGFSSLQEKNNSAPTFDHADSDNHKQLGSITDDSKMEYDYELSDNPIWIPEESNEAVDEVLIEPIQIFDSSAKGYSVHWNESNTKAKIGDIFGILSENNNRLEIALIRRISMNLEDDFRFGTEIIGFESEVVYIARPPHKENGTWAILIPGIKALRQSDTLIFSMGRFNPSHKILIYRNEEKTNGFLIKELHSTSGIVMAELNYPTSEMIHNTAPH